MQVITDINSIDQIAWQRLVEQSPTTTWFQTPDAYAFYVSVSHVLEPFVVAVQNEGSIQGIVVGYVTKEHNKIKNFLSRRAIIIGGPLLEQNIADEELTLLLTTLAQQLKYKAIYVETRNFCDFSRWRNVFADCGFDYQPHYDVHIDCSNETAMWQHITESKQRQIRHAQASGEVICEMTNINDLHNWYMLLDNLYKTKVHRPLFPENFFRDAVENGFCKLIIVKNIHNQVIGGVFGPVLSNKVFYEWYICGNVLSTYGAMNFCQQNGIPSFDTMGAGVPNVQYGVRDFKLQMGGKLHEYGRFIKKNDYFRYYLGKITVKLFLSLK